MIMKPVTTIFVMLLCTLILSNCAGRKEFVALPTTLQRDIGHTEAYIEEPQQTMRADVENSHVSSYTGGGLNPSPC